MQYTEEQLDTVISIVFIRERGYCAKGTKHYWKSLGLDFKKLLRQELTVRDLILYQEDMFIKQLIEELLGVKYGR